MAVFLLFNLIRTKIKKELKIFWWCIHLNDCNRHSSFIVDHQTICMFESIKFFDLVEKLKLRALRAIWFFVSVGHSHKTSQTQSMKKVCYVKKKKKFDHDAVETTKTSRRPFTKKQKSWNSIKGSLRQVVQSRLISFKMPIISAEGKRVLLNEYKYVSALSSWLEKNIMTPYWNYVVTLCPMSIAPNLITFIGTVQVSCL